MKAVWTTFGCWAAAAAPTAGAAFPLGDVLPESVAPSLCAWDCAWDWKGPWGVRSVAGGPLMAGGPMADEVEGVTSMGSLGGASVEEDEGRMGMDLWSLGLRASAEKGVERASATEAIAWREWGEGVELAQGGCAWAGGGGVEVVAMLVGVKRVGLQMGDEAAQQRFAQSQCESETRRRGRCKQRRDPGLQCGRRGCSVGGRGRGQAQALGSSRGLGGDSAGQDRTVQPARAVLVHGRGGVEFWFQKGRHGRRRLLCRSGAAAAVLSSRMGIGDGERPSAASKRPRLLLSDLCYCACMRMCFTRRNGSAAAELWRIPRLMH